MKARSRQLLEAAKKLRNKEIPGILNIYFHLVFLLPNNIETAIYKFFYFPDLQYMLSEQIGMLDMTERSVRAGKRDLAYINRALDGLPAG